jgi:hypothetical protein
VNIRHIHRSVMNTRLNPSGSSMDAGDSAFARRYASCSNLTAGRLWRGAPVVRAGYRIKSRAVATPEAGSEKRQDRERPGRFVHKPTKPEAHGVRNFKLLYSQSDQFPRPMSVCHGISEPRQKSSRRCWYSRERAPHHALDHRHNAVMDCLLALRS